MPKNSNISKLKDVIRANPKALSYTNFNVSSSGCSYSGWVSNFNIYKKSDSTHSNPFSLDLTTEEGKFQLFILAAAWSRSGQFENALYFLTYVHDNGLDEPSAWMDMNSVSERMKSRIDHAITAFDTYEDIRIGNRKAISFRPEFYAGTVTIAQNWQGIIKSLEESEKNIDYSIFVKRMREIAGLGGHGDKGKMSIKIPLILRELRVADVYKNIPGEWCCIPDMRVKKCCKDPFFDISLSTRGTFLTANKDLDAGIKTVLKQSEVIYRLFGDLYDIPLFAYQDLHNMRLI